MCVRACVCVCVCVGRGGRSRESEVIRTDWDRGWGEIFYVVTQMFPPGEILSDAWTVT